MPQGKWIAFVSDSSIKEFNFQEDREEHGILRKEELVKQNPRPGDRPVCVIGGMCRSREWTWLYNLGVERENATEEQRNHAVQMIGRLMIRVLVS